MSWRKKIGWRGPGRAAVSSMTGATNGVAGAAGGVAVLGPCAARRGPADRAHNRTATRVRCRNVINASASMTERSVLSLMLQRFAGGGIYLAPRRTHK